MMTSRLDKWVNYITHLFQATITLKYPQIGEFCKSHSSQLSYAKLRNV